MGKSKRKTAMLAGLCCMAALSVGVMLPRGGVALARDAAPETGWTRFEAESGVIVRGPDRGGSRFDNGDKASGGKAWVDINKAGESLALPVTVDEAGMYPIRLLGATGSTDNSVYVWNEYGYRATLLMESGNGWGEYSEDLYAESEIPLRKGTNILYLWKGENFIQVDALDVGPKSGAFRLPGKTDVACEADGEWTKYEAELARYVGDAKIPDKSETSSGRYVSDMNNENSQIQIPVYAEQDGEYAVEIKYSSDQDAQTLSLYVDGNYACETVSNGSTGGWSSFTKIMTADVMLHKGVNMVNIAKGNTGNACVDYLRVKNVPNDNATYAAYSADSAKISRLPDEGWSRFEAETAQTNQYNMADQTYFVYEGRGNSGYGYISDMHKADAYVEFTLPYVPAAGEYDVKVYYASKNETTTFNCTVNGTGEPVEFRSTQNTATQDRFVAANTLTAKATLQAGTNTLKFTQGASGDLGMEQFDAIDVHYSYGSTDFDLSSVKTVLKEGIDAPDYSNVSAVSVTSDGRVTPTESAAVTYKVYDSGNAEVTNFGKTTPAGDYRVKFTAGDATVSVKVTIAAVAASIDTSAVNTATELSSSLNADVLNSEIEKAVLKLSVADQVESYPYSSNKWTYTLTKDNAAVTEITDGVYKATLSLTDTAIEKSFDITVYAAQSATAVTQGVQTAFDAGAKVGVLKTQIEKAQMTVAMSQGVQAKNFAYATDKWSYAVKKGDTSIDLSASDATLEAGEYTVTMTYKAKTDVQATFTVTVSESATPTSISLSMATASIDAGATLDLSELKVTLTYSNGKTETLPAAAYTVDTSAVDTNKAGEYTVTVTYKDKPTITATLTVTVKAVAAPEKTGCGSAVGGACGVLAALALTGAAAMTTKKRKK